MVQLLGSDVLPALRSPDATKRRSAEAAFETRCSHEPSQILEWLLDRLMLASEMPDRQMAAVLLGRRLPIMWSRIPHKFSMLEQTSEVLMKVLQQETSRPVLVVTASALVTLAGAQESAVCATFVQDIVVFAGSLLDVSKNTELACEVGCIVVSELAQRLGEHMSASDVNSLRSALQTIIVNSSPSRLLLSAVSCLRHLGILQAETPLSLSCVAHIARRLLSDGVDSALKEDVLRTCFETLQEEQPPQDASLEVALKEVASLRQGADERTQAQAIGVLASAAKRLPALFGAEARRTCVQALCNICRSADQDDDSDVLADAACEGISTLAEALVATTPHAPGEQDSTVLALCWAFATAVSTSSSETDRACALRCLAAALVGIFRAAGRCESQGLQSPLIQLPSTITSAHAMLGPFAAATADPSAVVRRAAADGLSSLFEHTSSLREGQILAAVEDAIRRCLTNVAQELDVTVQNSVLLMVRAIILEMNKDRLEALLGCIVTATVTLAQRAVPDGIETRPPASADWTLAEDRLSIVAIIAEVAGAGFSPCAVQTATVLLRPLLTAPAVPLSVKLVALRALGPVLASTPPTSSGRGAELLPFWKDGLQLANEAIRSEEARPHCLGFYAALAIIFHGRQDSPVPLQEDAATIVPLDLVVSAALSALSVRGATGEAGPDCAKAFCTGAATAILQGGPRTWARTQSHEESRYALFALQTCAVSNGQSFLKVAPQVLPVLVPRFTEAASPPIRLAALGLLQEMGRLVTAAVELLLCSPEDLNRLHELNVAILHAVAGAISTEPRSAIVRREGGGVLTDLKARTKETSLIEHILKELAAGKRDHEDDSDSDIKDAMRINGHQISKAGG